MGQGAEDARQGKGQQDPNKFKNDAERKAYQADYNKQKEQQNKKNR